MQVAFRKGLLVLSTHNVTTATNSQVIKKIEGIYNEVFAELARVINDNSLKEKLKVAPLMPLFTVR
jgi:hypothetical protein